MDVLDEELLNFWKLLLQNNVRYIMIGGFAVNLHGFHRTTNDIDIWIDNTKQNRIALGKVLEKYEYLDINWETLEIISGWTNFFISKDLCLDIMIDMKGLEDYTFDECLQIASIATIDNIKIPFLHINQLIINKKATNRPKDQIDILELENIQHIRNQFNLE